MIALTIAVAAGAVEPPLVGLPFGRLDAAGLLVPTVSTVAPLSMRYPLDGGDGFAVVVVRPTSGDASAAFDGMAKTLATHWPDPGPALAGRDLGERTLGDGAGVVLVSSANAVVFVRDRGGRAAEVASRVLGAMTRDPADCAGETRLLDGRPADGCGRPR
jgi:hypothetical protein